MPNRIPRGSAVFVDPGAGDPKRVSAWARIPLPGSASYYEHVSPQHYTWEAGTLVRYERGGIAIVSFPGFAPGLRVPVSALRLVRDASSKLLDSPSPGAYVRAIRRGFELTAAGREVCIQYGFFLGADAFRAEVWGALDRRINGRAAYHPIAGREDAAGLRRDSRAVRDILNTRLRVYAFETETARSRFGHLLASPADD